MPAVRAIPTAASELDEYDNDDDPGYQRMDVVGQEATLGREYHVTPSLWRACSSDSGCVACSEAAAAAPRDLRRAAPGWLRSERLVSSPLALQFTQCVAHTRMLSLPHAQWSWTR